MNIYFCGIGGVGIGPLAEICLDAGHTIRGSDKNEGLMTKHLQKRGVPISFDQSGKNLNDAHDELHLDWFVYTAGIPEDHPELVAARSMDIHATKRDELIKKIIEEKDLELIAITGTHGKSTTTAMMVWTLLQMGIPVSYSVGATMSFGPSGHFDPKSKYFVYECDEFDRNFLKFNPALSIVTAIDYDHPDIYSSPEDYIAAFRQFIDQSAWTVMWQHDSNLVGEVPNGWLLGDHDTANLTLVGPQNRHNASLVVKAIERLGLPGDAVKAINSFPGTQRHFEKLDDNLYTDYGHHPAEVAATLGQAREVSHNVVLVYQPHQNVRQHELRAQYTDCFEQAEHVYWLPTYLTREDPMLPVLTPADLTENVTNKDCVTEADMNDELWKNIQAARQAGKLVLVTGAGSVDGWVRDKLAGRPTVTETAPRP